MTLYVGVDGGGSKTRVVAIDGGGRVRLDAETDGCDLPARGEASVRQVLRDVRGLVAGALGGADDAALALGLPAYGETGIWDEALDRLAAEIFAPWRYRVHNDVRLALEGALPDSAGVLVLSGTGSMAWGKDDLGREARCGGWGTLLGDEGSGFDLGVGALRAACRVEDGRGPVTALATEVPAALGVADMHGALALLSALPQPPRARVAALARTVVRVAEAGDAVAAALVDGAARELVDHVDALVARLALGEGAAVSTAGGGFHGAALAEAFADELTRRGYPAPRPPRYPPAFGGALLAGLAPARLEAGFHD
ncbi:MAG: BadF/BadG/BcrA/BcrD ATPase family protein [Deinococcales bacterium]